MSQIIRRHITSFLPIYSTRGVSWRLNDKSQPRLLGVLTPITCILLVYISIYVGNHTTRLLNFKVFLDDPYIRVVSHNESSFKRSEITYDEFYKRPPSMSSLSSFFHFDSSLYNESKIRVEKLWTCSAANKSSAESLEILPRTEKKLVFIHMTRSAGSTIRAFLRAYASLCSMGISMVGQCVDLGFEFMSENDVWSNGKGSHLAGRQCTLNSAVTRDGRNPMVNGGISNVSTAILKKVEVDILAGSLPLGCLDNFSHSQRHPVDVQYVALFREPLSKFVSELILRLRTIYGHQIELPIEKVVSIIEKYVDERIMSEHASLHYYDKYSNYMITPKQKAWVENEDVEWTPERRVSLTLRNMYSKNVVVGIVDDMASTFDLLNFMLDGTNQISALFRFFRSEDNFGNSNATRNFTTAVVDRITGNDALTSKLNEYLRYEYQIYEHALILHSKQLDWVQQTYGQ
jgi:hypothetical protein